MCRIYMQFDVTTRIGKRVIVTHIITNQGNMEVVVGVAGEGYGIKLSEVKRKRTKGSLTVKRRKKGRKKEKVANAYLFQQSVFGYWV